MNIIGEINMTLKIKSATILLILLAATTAWAAPGKWIALDHLGLRSIRSVVGLDGSRFVITDGIGRRAVAFDFPAAGPG